MKFAVRWIPAVLAALAVWAGAVVPVAAQEADDPASSWYTRDSKFSRLADVDKRARLGLIPPDRAPIAPSPAAPMVAPLAALPASFDWRDQGGGNFVTNVRDQGNCGGCWAFAATAALESKVLITENTPGVGLNLSEQIVLSCSGGGNCGGGYLDTAAAFLRDDGTALETCYPYTAANGSCGNACGNWGNNAFRVRSYSDDYYYTPATQYDNGATVPNDPNRSSRKGLIKNLVATKGPVMVAFTVYNDFYSYGGGVYRKSASAYLVGYHAVAVVGWKDTADSYGGYFIVKNSWDTDWGEGGFFKIGYDQLTNGQASPNFGWWIVSLGDSFRTQPLADLQCPDIFVSGSPVFAGDACSVQGNIRNDGNAGAPGSTARLYLSTDNDADLSDDLDLGTVPVGSLGTGGETLVQWDFTAPAPGATPLQIWPIVVVDAGNVVPESNENNVWKASSPLLTVEPPAWVQVISPNGGNKWTRGKTYAFTWGQSNCGAGAGTVTVQLLMRTDGIWKVKKTIKAGVDAALGTVSWKIGSYFATGSYFKARVTCDQDGTLVDESDARFSIK